MTCLAWSPGTPGMLASGEGLGQDGRGGGKIILWDVRQAKSKLQSLDYNNVKGRPRDPSRLANAAHQGRVLGIAFTGCGRYLVSVGKDHRLVFPMIIYDIDNLCLCREKGSALGPGDGEEPEDKVPRSGHRPLLFTALDAAPCLHNRLVAQHFSQRYPTESAHNVIFSFSSFTTSSSHS